jgi:polyhydroxybutyrate depolymerase
MGYRLVLGLLVVLLAGCSSGTPAQTRSPDPTATAASAPASTPIEPTASPSDDLVVGGDRPVTVHVPASYSAATPAPLLIMLHGYGSSGREHEGYFHLGSAADARGVIYAHPDGTMDSDGDRFWNATDACCDFSQTGVADADYLSALVASIVAAVNVDPKRIYFIGHSNGGFMSYRMACDHADLVAGIVSLAGTTFAEPADCRPSEPVTILQIHGTADDVIAYDGGRITGIGASGVPMDPYPGALDTVTSWATYDGCSEAASDRPGSVDVDANIDGADGPAESTIKAATGCQGGGHVELWTIPVGRHDPDISAAFADEVLDFLLAHPKP